MKVKKILALLVVLTFVLSACGSGDNRIVQIVAEAIAKTKERLA